MFSKAGTVKHNNLPIVGHHTTCDQPVNTESKNFVPATPYPASCCLLLLTRIAQFAGVPLAQGARGGSAALSEALPSYPSLILPLSSHILPQRLFRSRYESTSVESI
jgi:hypothetical protein